jgi:hypothetical protein
VPIILKINTSFQVNKKALNRAFLFKVSVYSAGLGFLHLHLIPAIRGYSLKIADAGVRFNDFERRRVPVTIIRFSAKIQFINDSLPTDKINEPAHFLANKQRVEPK